MAEQASIPYGGRVFRVRPLTLRQIRDILPALNIAASGFGTAESMQACAVVIAAALGRDHPEMTLDAVLDCETAPSEITGAVNAIVTLSGLVPAGEAPAGSDWTP